MPSSLYTGNACVSLLSNIEELLYLMNSDEVRSRTQLINVPVPAGSAALLRVIKIN